MTKTRVIMVLVLALLLTGCIRGGTGGTARISVSWHSESRDVGILALSATPALLEGNNLAYTDSPMEGGWLVAEAEVRGVQAYSSENFEFRVVSDHLTPNNYEVGANMLTMDREFADEGFIHVKYGELEAISPYKIYPSNAIGSRHNSSREIYTHFDFESGEANNEAGDIYMVSDSNEIWTTHGYAALPKGDTFNLFWGDFPTDIDFEAFDYIIGSFEPNFESLYLIKTQNGYAKVIFTSWQSVPAWNLIWEYAPNEV